MDPEGVYRVQVDGEPAQLLVPRITRTIQALLSRQAKSAVALGLRAQTPGTMRFLDLLVVGDEDRFVERAIRIGRLAAEEGHAARAAIRAASPGRTGRVT